MRTLAFNTDASGAITSMACVEHYLPFTTADCPYGNVGPTATSMADIGGSILIGTVGGGLQVYSKTTFLESDCVLDQNPDFGTPHTCPAG